MSKKNQAKKYKSNVLFRYISTFSGVKPKHPSINCPLSYTKLSLKTGIQRDISWFLSLFARKNNLGGRKVFQTGANESLLGHIAHGKLVSSG